MAPAPHRTDGKPDFTGPWHLASTRWVNSIAVDMKPGELAMQPWAGELTKVHAVNQAASQDDEPDVNCRAGGVPIDGTPHPVKIVSVSPKLMVILYGTFGMYRQLFADGREFDPNSENNLAWLAFSAAKWDGETLVVHTFGGNGRTWLDKAGHPTSEALHVTERFPRVDSGHMNLGLTIDLPNVFTKTWSITRHFLGENERDAQHMTRATQRGARP